MKNFYMGRPLIRSLVVLLVSLISSQIARWWFFHALQFPAALHVLWCRHSLHGAKSIMMQPPFCRSYCLYYPVASGWLSNGWAGSPCSRLASVNPGLMWYRLALPARIGLFVFVSGFWVWFLIPAPGSFRSRSSAPPGLGFCLVVCSRLCPHEVTSGKALAYLVGAGALVALATVSLCFCL